MGSPLVYQIQVNLCRKWLQHQANTKMTSETALLNGTILAPDRTLRAGAIYWNPDGIITRVEGQPAPGEGAFDAPGLLICPGFINLHVHGGLGADTLDATPGALATLAYDQARQGVTAFLPTAASASQETLLRVCEAVRAYRERLLAGPENEGAELLGLHLEGPYLSPEKAGAQNPAHFRDPSWEEFCAWQAASGKAVRLLALAPERDPNGMLIERVAATGVRVAAAHTNASYEIARTAIRRGLSHGTHVFNAMSRFDYRTPGVLEALLEDDRVTLELIPDCTEMPHVHPVAIRLLKRLVGVGRICAVTDAICAAGMEDGVYALGGLAVRKAGDAAFLEGPWQARGERRLAGSALRMNDGVRNLIELAGFSLPEAVEAASLNPARALGVQAVKGSLEPGKHADITVLRPGTLEVVATFVRGKQVYGHG